MSSRPAAKQPTAKATTKLHQTTLASAMRRKTRSGDKKGKANNEGKTDKPDTNDMLAEDQFPPLASTNSKEETGQDKGRGDETRNKSTNNEKTTKNQK